ncbi:MAG: hypothetical protein ABI776_16445 [Nocardioidaceae bacterium]
MPLQTVTGGADAEPGCGDPRRSSAVAYDGLHARLRAVAADCLRTR